MPALEPPPPPSGPDVNHAWAGTIVLWLIAALATVLTALRVYTRIFILKRLGWDDYLNIIGMVLALATQSLMTRAIVMGIGRHLYYVIQTGDLEEAIDGMLLVRCSELIIVLSLAALKISITIFLIRVFDSYKKLKWFLIGWITFNTIINLLLVSVVFASCTPVELEWNPTVDGTCWPHIIVDSIGYIQAAASCLTDIILSSIPIILLWNVQMARKRKIGICVLMAMGYATTAFSIVRCFYVRIWQSKDITWDVVDLYIFGVLEALVAAIVAALPTLRPFLRHFIKGTTTPSQRQPYASGTARVSTLQRPGWQTLGNDLELQAYGDDVEKSSTETFDDQQLKYDSQIRLTTDIDVSRGTKSPPKALLPGNPV